MKNFSTAAVAVAPSPATSGTSVGVTAGQGSRFALGKATLRPSSGVSDPTNSEVVTITGISAGTGPSGEDMLTITRAQESSSARTVSIGDRLVQGITAGMWDGLSGTYGPSPTDDIVQWGDSLTQQMGAANLAAATGRTVRNGGVGGESSITIATRQGAHPFRLLPSGNAIPTSGGVAVTIAEPSGQWPLLQGAGTDGGSFTGSLAGVPGTLTLAQPSGPSYSHLSDDVYTFTRAAAGSSVAVTRPQPFQTDFATARRTDIAVIWVGRNNYSDPDQVVGDVLAMIDHLSPSQKRYLVVGVTNGRMEGTGSSALTSINALNLKLSQRFGRRYLDMKGYLVSYGLSDAGITATTGDAADIAAGIIPNSLRTDAVHLTTAGYVVASNAIATRLLELGYISSVSPVAPPAPPAARTNLQTNGEFEANTTGWSTNGAATITRDTTQAFAGLASVRLDHSSATNSSIFWNGTKLTVTPGQVVTARAMILAPLSTVNPRILLHEYTAASAYVNNQAASVTPTGAWQVITVTKTIGGTGGLVQVEINKSGSDATTPTWYIDSIEVY